MFGLRVFPMEVPRGTIPRYDYVNKFGRATVVDQATVDIWDGNSVWVPPTQARIHDIASTDVGDISGGAGARTVKVLGLTSWDMAEVSETITLNGLTDVPTVNAYVIIHRMFVATSGATSINIGAISATAQTDATVTAQILAVQGQTQMAIYGVPTSRDFFMTLYYASMNRGSPAAGNVDISMVVNYAPDEQLGNFRITQTRGLMSTGISAVNHPFDPYARIPGPAIVKVQGIGSANGNDISAGFDGYLYGQS